jgi:hypothetical protein
MQGNNILNFNDKDYYNSAVIEPPKEYMYYENDKKYTRIVIDSKDRGAMFMNPNQYEIVLDDDINDVVSAQLVSADIPFSSYMINSSFNSTQITFSNASHIITLDTGDYNVTDLAEHIEEKMNTISATTFQVSYNTRKDNYIIKSKSPFSINFAEPNSQASLGMLLGFATKTYHSIVDNASSPYSYVIASPFRKNFNYNKYAYLVIDQFDLNKGNAKPINKSFAALTEQYQSLSMNDKPHIIKYFSPTIPRLAKLKISFYDRFGNPYDFQNQDHRLEILFTSFKQRSKYQNIFS